MGRRSKYMTKGKRLTRSKTDKWLAGVCGGIANYFDWDPAIVRLVYILLTFGTAFSGVIVYIILALFMPDDPNN